MFEPCYLILTAPTYLFPLGRDIYDQLGHLLLRIVLGGRWFGRRLLVGFPHPPDPDGPQGWGLGVSYRLLLCRPQHGDQITTK